MIAEHGKDANREIIDNNAKYLGKERPKAHNFTDYWNSLEFGENVSTLPFKHLVSLVGCGERGYGRKLICPRDGRLNCSIVDAKFKRPSTRARADSKHATDFMSWVWDYPAKEVLQAIKNWLDRQVENGRKKEDIFIWWCFVCNNQYRILEEGVDKQKSPQELEGVFGNRLKKIGRMFAVVCLVSVADKLILKYIERAWCVYEVHECKEKGFDFQIVFSDETIVKLKKDGFKEVANVFGSVGGS
jgi:hypothetical protein